MYIEGDASSASYFLAGAAITGGVVTVHGCGRDSIQVGVWGCGGGAVSIASFFYSLTPHILILHTLHIPIPYLHYTPHIIYLHTPLPYIPIYIHNLSTHALTNLSI